MSSSSNHNFSNNTFITLPTGNSRAPAARNPNTLIPASRLPVGFLNTGTPLVTPDQWAANRDAAERLRQQARLLEDRNNAGLMNFQMATELKRMAEQGQMAQRVLQRMTANVTPNVQDTVISSDEIPSSSNLSFVSSHYEQMYPENPRPQATIEEVTSTNMLGTSNILNAHHPHDTGVHIEVSGRRWDAGSQIPAPRQQSQGNVPMTSREILEQGHRGNQSQTPQIRFVPEPRIYVPHPSHPPVEPFVNGQPTHGVISSGQLHKSRYRTHVVKQQQNQFRTRDAKSQLPIDQQQPGSASAQSSSSRSSLPPANGELGRTYTPPSQQYQQTSSSLAGALDDSRITSDATLHPVPSRAPQKAQSSTSQKLSSSRANRATLPPQARANGNSGDSRFMQSNSVLPESARGAAHAVQMHAVAGRPPMTVGDLPPIATLPVTGQSDGHVSIQYPHSMQAQGQAHQQQVPMHFTEDPRSTNTLTPNGNQGSYVQLGQNAQYAPYSHNARLPKGTSSLIDKPKGEENGSLPRADSTNGLPHSPAIAIPVTPENEKFRPTSATPASARTSTLAKDLLRALGRPLTKRKASSPPSSSLTEHGPAPPSKRQALDLPLPQPNLDDQRLTIPISTQDAIIPGRAESAEVFNTHVPAVPDIQERVANLASTAQAVNEGSAQPLSPTLPNSEPELPEVESLITTVRSHEANETAAFDSALHPFGEFEAPLFLPSPEMLPVINVENHDVADITGEMDGLRRLPSASSSRALRLRGPTPGLQVFVELPRRRWRGRGPEEIVPPVSNSRDKAKSIDSLPISKGGYQVVSEGSESAIAPASSVDALLGVRLPQAREAVTIASSRLRRRPCNWQDCTYVFDSADKLKAHIGEHVDLRLKFPQLHSIATCHWNSCGRRFNDAEQLLDHARKHVEQIILCPYKDCEDQFRLPLELLDHIESRHADGKGLRPEAVLQRHVTSKRLPPLPQRMYAYRTINLPVKMVRMNKEWRAILGPWVLKRIFGPVSLNIPRQNARLPLRISGRAPGDRVVGGFDSRRLKDDRSDRYEFMAAMDWTSREKTFPYHCDDLDSVEISELVEKGLMIAPDARGPSGPLGEQLLTAMAHRLGDAGNAKEEQGSDLEVDELYASPTSSPGKFQAPSSSQARHVLPSRPHPEVEESGLSPRSPLRGRLESVSPADMHEGSPTESQAQLKAELTGSPRRQPHPSIPSAIQTDGDESPSIHPKSGQLHHLQPPPASTSRPCPTIVSEEPVPHVSDYEAQDIGLVKPWAQANHVMEEIAGAGEEEAVEELV